jgi:hypothetical protein
VRTGIGAKALRLAPLALALGVVAATPARACQSCFGAADAPMLDGARAGGWALIALTVGIEGAFVGFFIYLRRRFKKAARSAQGLVAFRPRPFKRIR